MASQRISLWRRYIKFLLTSFVILTDDGLILNIIIYMNDIKCVCLTSGKKLLPRRICNLYCGRHSGKNQACNNICKWCGELEGRRTIYSAVVEEKIGQNSIYNVIRMHKNSCKIICSATHCGCHENIQVCVVCDGLMEIRSLIGIIQLHISLYDLPLSKTMNV